MRVIHNFSKRSNYRNEYRKGDTLYFKYSKYYEIYIVHHKFFVPVNEP